MTPEETLILIGFAGATAAAALLGAGRRPEREPIRVPVDRPRRRPDTAETDRTDA
ncbi:hypothetical protein P2H44_10550 [Albimonas sp. CAU 1670]|uniref:hypothetical protein n=1 Tax=Albimonas sp. CAU 1670 TaxID=3032599 RepID=UPI0023DA6740|nr:hypothetical protein [Albimonas sp. CAU 1670]MDF2232994.1 hypothetical protein [Albimonas sp. CAU 1670]